MRILGVDYGRKKIGLALSDPLGMAHPLKTEPVLGKNDAAEKILKLAKEKEAAEVIIGYPLKTDGTAGEMALEVQKLAGILKREGMAVALIDERFSSEQAVRSLHLMGKKSGGKHKQDIDAMAAALILQVYLDRKSRNKN